ncbi:MAG TPA: HAD family hydrolase [Kofleriaceae bacterium]|jgi:putative hydrolase of the HAD superfamily|nr:HAD family hydrolase [Kofleriaceae bacterium]
MFRAVFLDLDDTLFDRTAAMRRWAIATLPAFDDDDERWLLACDARGRRTRLEFATEVVARFGLTTRPEVLASAFSLQLAAQVEREAGVRELIARLAIQTRVAVVTNGSGAAQRMKLRRLGLDQLIHAVFISGELGVAKPDPEIFWRALRWSGQTAADCLFVGDDPVNDIAPAAALGLVTAWRARDPWPSELAPPAHPLGSLAELERLCA